MKEGHGDQKAECLGELGHLTVILQAVRGLEISEQGVPVTEDRHRQEF